jgi:hypothetical protein
MESAHERDTAGIETRRKTEQSRARATRDAGAKFARYLLMPVMISRKPRFAWRIRAITGEFFSRETIRPVPAVQARVHGNLHGSKALIRRVKRLNLHRILA